MYESSESGLYQQMLSACLALPWSKFQGSTRQTELRPRERVVRTLGARHCLDTNTKSPLSQEAK